MSDLTTAAIEAVRSSTSMLENLRPLMQKATVQLNQQTERIEKLEECLRRMIQAHDECNDNSEGHWPGPDSGCIDCTLGTVPNRYNTGPCAYHHAKRLLGAT